jgi:hypothetical protein
LLLQEDGAIGEGDVVIGGKECDQGDHGAAEGLKQALAIQAQPRAERGGGWRRQDWRLWWLLGRRRGCFWLGFWLDWIGIGSGGLAGHGWQRRNPSI